MKKRFLAGLLLFALLAVSVAALPGVTASAEAPEKPADLPDVDIHSWEYKLANAYNSVAFYICEYGPIEGQGLDPRVVASASALLKDARAAGYTIYMAQAFRNLEWLENMYLQAYKRCEYDPILTASRFKASGLSYTSDDQGQC